MLPFLGLANNFFLKSNAFQTIFFITFCDENNFLQPFLKIVTGFFIDLIWKKNTSCACIHMKVSSEWNKLTLNKLYILVIMTSPFYSCTLLHNTPPLLPSPYRLSMRSAFSEMIKWYICSPRGGCRLPTSHYFYLVIVFTAGQYG